MNERRLAVVMRDTAEGIVRFVNENDNIDKVVSIIYVADVYKCFYWEYV